MRGALSAVSEVSSQLEPIAETLFVFPGLDAVGKIDWVDMLLSPILFEKGLRIGRFEWLAEIF